MFVQWAFPFCGLSICGYKHPWMPSMTHRLPPVHYWKPLLVVSGGVPNDIPGPQNISSTQLEAADPNQRWLLVKSARSPEEAGRAVQFPENQM